MSYIQTKTESLSVSTGFAFIEENKVLSHKQKLFTVRNTAELVNQVTER